jgi:tetratricopeptide (TPR) repeat protein
MTEIQLNLLPVFDVLGQEGYSLHRELRDIDYATSKREIEPMTGVSFDMKELIAETLSQSSSKFNFHSFFNDKSFDNEKVANAERKEESKDFEPLYSVVQEDSTNGQELNDSVIKEAANFAASSDDRNFNDIIQSETRSILLEKLMKDTNYSINGREVYLAILQYGSNEASRSPRDVATYFCLYALFSFVLNLKSDETISAISCGVEVRMDLVVEYARQCLLQCLTISNQAVSVGMTGWLEYGELRHFEQFAALPYTILRHLAYDFARRNRWADAECLCLALVVRCEEHLPLHHPTTLTSLFDLAISSSMMGNQSFANRTLYRAAERLSRYLQDIENSYIAHLAKAMPDSKQTEAMFRIDHGRDDIFKLHAFASLFQRQLNRDMALLIGAGNEVMLTNHCFVADTLAVLANCISAAKFFLGSVSDRTDDCGLVYWKLAYQHYEHCYRGLVTTKSLDDPSVSRSLYGIARCLREIGETDKALKMLSLLVSFAGNRARDQSINLSERAVTLSIDNAPIEEDKSKQLSTLAPRFLPISAQLKTRVDKSHLYSLMSSALCLWLMAILTVDHKRTEEGRERAFGYLHAASISLQDSLHNASDIDDQVTRAMCIRFLAMIENEAEQISEPMYE